MTTLNFKIGQVVKYSNGNHSIYTGTIVKITGEYLTVIDDEAGMELWSAGFSVGSYIHTSQIK